MANRKTAARTMSGPATTARAGNGAARMVAWLRDLGYQPEPIESSLIALRLPTRQLEVPLLVHVDDIVFFDLYPFRFLTVELAAVDWPFLIQLTTATQLIKVCVDLDSGEAGAAPLFFSVQLPHEVLTPSLVGGVVELLRSFAEERHEVVRTAVRLGAPMPGRRVGRAKRARGRRS